MNFRNTLVFGNIIFNLTQYFYYNEDWITHKIINNVII